MSTAAPGDVVAQHPRGAIVYLTQSRPSSTIYEGRDHLHNLRQSVRLLYRHYNDKQRDDVLFFHDGTVPLDEQKEVLRLCVAGTAQFVRLARSHFETPSQAGAPAKWWHAKRFSAGYRHMIRFFTVGLWPLLEQLGYEYVMRLDDDSFLWSPIRYNIFDSMQSRRLEYGFRLAGWERGLVFGDQNHFHELVRRYAVQHGLELGWLAHTCADPADALANFSVLHCGNMYTVYNNFFVSSIAFWRRLDVRGWIEHADAGGWFYTHRYGDALWHSAALALFLAPSQLWQFDDFAYEHTSFKSVAASKRRKPMRCWWHGGLAPPMRGADTEADLALARSRLANLSAVAVACRDTSYKCIYAPAHGRVRGLFAGRVSVEHPTCDRTPAPFFCGGPMLKREMQAQERLVGAMQLAAEHRKKVDDCTHTPAGIANFVKFGQPAWHAEYQEAKRREFCYLGVAQLMERRQYLTICVNWCDTKNGSVRRAGGTGCRARANAMWQVLAGQRAVARGGGKLRHVHASAIRERERAAST